MRPLFALAAVLALSAPALAQCRYGGYQPQAYHAPAYVAPKYVAPAYAPQAVTQRTEVRTSSGADVRVVTTTTLPVYAPPGYGYAYPVLTLPGAPTTEVVTVVNVVDGAGVGGATVVRPVPQSK